MRCRQMLTCSAHSIVSYLIEERLLGIRWNCLFVRVHLRRQALPSGASCPCGQTQRARRPSHRHSAAQPAPAAPSAPSAPSATAHGFLLGPDCLSFDHI